LLRPGRIDKSILCDLPTEEERADILHVHTQDMDLADDVDIAALAKLTAQYSCADLKALVTNAHMQATTSQANLAGTSLARIDASEATVQTPQIVFPAKLYAANHRPSSPSLHEQDYHAAKSITSSTHAVSEDPAASQLLQQYLTSVDIISRALLTQTEHAEQVKPIVLTQRHLLEALQKLRPSLSPHVSVSPHCLSLKCLQPPRARLRLSLKQPLHINF
jgi:SpoVK/Ycf46/Vps4 family AAA+-type ATPase